MIFVQIVCSKKLLIIVCVFLFVGRSLGLLIGFVLVQKHCRSFVIKSGTGLMGGKDKSHKRDKRNKGNFDDTSKKKVSGKAADGSFKTENFAKHRLNYAPHQSVVRY